MLMSSKISKRIRKPKKTRIKGGAFCTGPASSVGTVSVVGIEYNVVAGEDMYSYFEKDDSDENVRVRGAVNYHRQMIVLESTLADDQREVTLLHEIVHAVDDALNISLTEEQVGLLAAGLYSVSFKGSKVRDKVRTMKGVFYG